jgi:hypothetical protein
MAMMLLIPFAYELRSRTLSSVTTAIFLTAAATTLSRTAVLVGVPLILGVLSRKRERGTVFLLVCGLVLAGVVVTIRTDAFAAESIKTAWVDRLNGRDAVDNADVRQAAAQAVIDWVWSSPSPLTLIFGQGLNRGGELASGLGARADTIDNVYFTLLYEAGLLGLALFIGAYLQLLRATWRFKNDRCHWFAIVAWLGAGFAFVSIFYTTFSVLVVASIAMLTTRRAAND